LSSKKTLYDNGSKKTIETDSDDKLLQTFTDTIISSDGKKNGRVKGKGSMNNAIAAHIFDYLESYHILTHFLKKVNDRDMEVKTTESIPIKLFVYNETTPALSKTYGFEKKAELPVPVLEFYYNNDDLNHPMINEFHATALGVASQEDFRTISHDGLKINAILKPFFERRGLNLSSFWLHFGKHKGKIILASEITPDNCRLMDIESKSLLSYERFDKNLGKVAESYRDVHDRILGENN
jgi:phosphoribosylaminoimidazole-succinocarboxamide synthase